MSYIGNSPGVASQRIVNSFTATQGQTLFTPSSGYSLGYLDIYLNGAKLVNGQDYTASNGTTFTLTQAAALNDVVESVAYIPRGLSDGYLKSEVDAFAVKLTGDQTIAGVKALNGGFYNGAQTIIASATTLSNTNLGGFIELVSNSFTLTLPNPALCNGGGLTIWNNGPACTLAAPSGNFYGPFGNSAATIPIPNQVTYNLRSDGYNWIIVNSQSVGANSASSAPPVYGARAWVNFNGTGTVAIRASGNVSSITDLGTGRYQVNFTTALPDANYAVNIVSAIDGTYGVSGQIKSAQVENTGTILTTSCVIGAAVTNTTASVDSAVMCASFFR